MEIDARLLLLLHRRTRSLRTIRAAGPALRPHAGTIGRTPSLARAIGLATWRTIVIAARTIEALTALSEVFTALAKALTTLTEVFTALSEILATFAEALAADARSLAPFAALLVTRRVARGRLLAAREFTSRGHAPLAIGAAAEGMFSARTFAALITAARTEVAPLAPLRATVAEVFAPGEATLTGGASLAIAKAAARDVASGCIAATGPAAYITIAGKASAALPFGISAITSGEPTT